MSRSLLEHEIRPYACNCFVETGTYIGGGVLIALKAGFKNVVSIELGEKQFLHSKERFKNDKRVEIIQGNSPDVLRKVLPRFNENIVIFLDAHSPAYNPILDELGAIKEQNIKTHTIMIDDLGEYGPKRYWKEMLVSDLIDKVLEINPNYRISYMRSFNKTDDILVAEIK